MGHHGHAPGIGLPEQSGTTCHDVIDIYSDVVGQYAEHGEDKHAVEDVGHHHHYDDSQRLQKQRIELREMAIADKVGVVHSVDGETYDDLTKCNQPEEGGSKLTGIECKHDAKTIHTPGQGEGIERES